MVNLTQNKVQFFLVTSIGFSLAMFLPIDLAWSKNNEAVLDSILAIAPVLEVIVVSLTAVTASLFFFLGIIKLNNMDEDFPVMESALVFSSGGIVIAFTSGLSSSQGLNAALVTATVINIGIFLVSFAWNSAKYIHSFLNDRK